MSAQKFFSALYGDLPDEAYIEVWSKDGGAQYARSFEDAAALAAGIVGNAYYGVCLAPRTESFRRADAQSVLYAPALWADIDVVSAHHSKENLPPHENAAYALLMDAMPLAPSCIISTGGGLHAYWFFHELWPLEDDADRVRFASVIKGWQAMLRAAMKKHGWDLDATHDLARIMRVPGTWNANANAQSSITFLDETMRYELDDFAQYVDVDLSAAEQEALLSFSKEFRHIHIVPRRGHSGVEPLFSRVMLLAEMEERFRASLDGRNPLLTDDSLSTKDASMAWWMALYDSRGTIPFSDQDMADVLVDARVAHAKRAKDLKKASRVDYLQRTIAHARTAVAEGAPVQAEERTEANSPFQDAPSVEVMEIGSSGANEAQPELPEILSPSGPETAAAPVAAKPVPLDGAEGESFKAGDSASEPQPFKSDGTTSRTADAEQPDDDTWAAIPPIPEGKREAWDSIGAKLGLRVFRAVCYVNVKPKELRLVCQPRVGGAVVCVTLTSDVLLSRSKSKLAFFEATNRVPLCFSGEHPIKAFEWDGVAEQIMDACPMDALPDEATEEGLLRVYLKRYVQSNLDAAGRASTDLEEAAASGRPFLAAGRIHINVTAFAQYLRAHGVGEWNSATKIAKGLLKLKMRKRRQPYHAKDGSYHAITGYVIPDTLELELANELPSADVPEQPSAANLQ